MVADYKKKTDEELIAIVNKYMEDHPNANRNHIILHAHGNHQRIRDLDKKGLINLPKALPKGSNSNWAKYFSYASESNAKRTGMKYNV
jgi:rRNA pseudouridine-1189 N-methylase Emg1 (Nep1/Mra1 family)